jgi:hypothetical protein
MSLLDFLRSLPQHWVAQHFFSKMLENRAKEIPNILNTYLQHWVPIYNIYRVTMQYQKIWQKHELVSNAHKTLQHLRCAFATKHTRVRYKFNTCMQHQKNPRNQTFILEHWPYRIGAPMPNLARRVLSGQGSLSPISPPWSLVFLGPEHDRDLRFETLSWPWSWLCLNCES